MVEFRKYIDGRVVRRSYDGATVVCIFNDGTTGGGMVGLTEQQCDAAWVKFYEPVRPELPGDWEWSSWVPTRSKPAPWASHTRHGNIHGNGASDADMRDMTPSEIDELFEARRIVMEEAGK